MNWTKISSHFFFFTRLCIILYQIYRILNVTNRIILSSESSQRRHFVLNSRILLTQSRCKNRAYAHRLTRHARQSVFRTIDSTRAGERHSNTVNRSRIRLVYASRRCFRNGVNGETGPRRVSFITSNQLTTFFWQTASNFYWWKMFDLPNPALLKRNLNHDVCK